MSLGQIVGGIDVQVTARKIDGAGLLEEIAGSGVAGELEQVREAGAREPSGDALAVGVAGGGGLGGRRESAEVIGRDGRLVAGHENDSIPTGDSGNAKPQ